MTNDDSASSGSHPVAWRRRALAASALLLTLGVGIGLGILIPIARAPSDSSAEAGFARDMSSHHAQAVEMSMLALQKATLPDVRRLGLDIGLTQQAQIGIMRAWLQQWNLSLTTTAPRMTWMTDGSAMNHGADKAPTSDLPSDGLMPGMATDDEMDRLRTAEGAAFDILFCELMIRHHRGGIAMVDAALEADVQQPVNDLATSMKNGQQSEIGALNQLLERLRTKT